MKLRKHNYVLSTQRTRELKKSIQAVEREISTVRGRIFTEVFSRNEEKPLIVKRALAYRTVLENLPIRIYDEELIVGGITEKRKGAFLAPETNIDGMAIGGTFNQPAKKVINKGIDTLAGLVNRIDASWGTKILSAKMLFNMKLDNPENRSSQRFRIDPEEKWVGVCRPCSPAQNP